jgi:hypothetical protein
VARGFTWLLLTFSLHLGMGSTCLAPIAAAASPVPEGVLWSFQPPMTQAGGVCVAVVLMSSVNEEGSMQGGCADGHCFKMRSPEPSGFTAHAPTPVNPVALPVLTAVLALNVDPDSSYDEIVNASPGPPGLGMVVMRE